MKQKQCRTGYNNPLRPPS